MSLQLEHIQTFYAVAETGSLSSAARKLGLSHPTVRRHIEALEADIGVALFTRAPNGLTLTAGANQLIPLAENLVAQAKAFSRAAETTKKEGGVVRITTVPIVASQMLPGILSDLRKKAPDIRIELSASANIENLSSRAADIAIRMQTPHQDALVVKKLPPLEFCLFGAPELPKPRTIEEISNAPMVSDEDLGVLEEALKKAGLPKLQNIVLKSNDFNVQLAAIRAGLGFGGTAWPMAKRYGLEPIFPEYAQQMPFYAVMHEDQRSIPIIRTVFDHLVEHLTAILRQPK